MTITIACNNCLAKNRIPDERIGDGPKCGRCKQPLFEGMPLELTGAKARAIIDGTDIPVVIDCWAPWCGPCRSFAPVFEQAARELEPRLRFAKLDTEQHPALAGEWGIRSIPTLIVLHEGEVAARISGAMSLPQFKQWLTEQGLI